MIERIRLLHRIRREQGSALYHVPLVNFSTFNNIRHLLSTCSMCFEYDSLESNIIPRKRTSSLAWSGVSSTLNQITSFNMKRKIEEVVSCILSLSKPTLALWQYILRFKQYCIRFFIKVSNNLQRFVVRFKGPL